MLFKAIDPNVPVNEKTVLSVVKGFSLRISATKCRNGTASRRRVKKEETPPPISGSGRSETVGADA